MGAEVTILQTDTGWKVIARDANDIKVEVEGGDVIVRVHPTPDTETTPLDVKLTPAL